MLRIYPIALEMIADVRVYADAIAAHDKDLARQLRRASMSVLLNQAEGSGCRGGTPRARYDALGFARETLAGLEGAVAAGYLSSISREARARLDRIIGTLIGEGGSPSSSRRPRDCRDLKLAGSRKNETAQPVHGCAVPLVLAWRPS